MESQRYTLTSIRQDILDNNLHVKAIIQDILAFRGTMVELDTFNEVGRVKLAALRKGIERLDDWARDENDPAVLNEVDTHREQFSRTRQAFRNANISAVMEIKKLNRDELFAMSPEGSDLRQRHSTNIKSNRSTLLAQQESVTDRMLAISQRLSETTQKSADTLETLLTSSTSVEDTRDELLKTTGTISQSGKLLKKYGRRECTDKLLMGFAFIFFLACVFYVVWKRLF